MSDDHASPADRAGRPPRVWPLCIVLGLQVAALIVSITPSIGT